MEIADFVRIALGYDTLMSAAMLAACGVAPAPARTRVAAPRESRYADVRWCFENHGSPMDSR